MKKIAWVLAGIGLGGVLGWLALREIVWVRVFAALQTLNWHLLVLALSAAMFAGLLTAYRWKLLLPGEKVSMTRLFLVRSAGQGANNVSPLRIVSEIIQTAMLSQRDGLKVPTIVSSILMARFFDLLVTVNLVGAGLIVLPQLSGFKPVVLPLWGMTVVALVAFVLLGRRIHRLPGIHRLPSLEKVLRSIETLRKRQIALLGCFVLTAVAWMSIGVAAWLVALAAGVSLPFWLMCIVIVAVSAFSGAIPAPPGMVGVYEFVAVSTLGFFAVDPSAALTFALVIHLVLFLPAVLIGIPVLALERRTAARVLALATMVVQRNPVWRKR